MADKSNIFNRMGDLQSSLHAAVFNTSSTNVVFPHVSFGSMYEGKDALGKEAELAATFIQSEVNAIRMTKRITDNNAPTFQSSNLSSGAMRDVSTVFTKSGYAGSGEESYLNDKYNRNVTTRASFRRLRNSGYVNKRGYLTDKGKRLFRKLYTVSAIEEPQKQEPPEMHTFANLYNNDNQ